MTNVRIQGAREQAASGWTMDELLDRMRRAIARLIPDDQPRYKVTDVPDARTVRYYVSLGLVDQPAGRRGTSALYTQKHLLQILAIKKLQSEYLPIRKIQEMLHGRTIPRLHALLGHAISLEELVAGRQDGESDPPARNTEREAAGPSVVRAPGASSVRPGGAQGAAATSWERFQIVPGVELHVRQDLAPSSADRATIVRIIRTILDDERA